MVWVSWVSSSLVGALTQRNRARDRLAQFEWGESGPRSTKIEVSEQGQALFSASLCHRPIPLPMHTALLPMPLAQSNGQELLLTTYSGHGVAYPARLETLAPMATACRPCSSSSH